MGSEEEEDEDALMQQALALSMASAQPPAAPAIGDSGASTSSSSGTASSVEGNQSSFINPEFVKQLFGDNDVDLNDPIIQAALEQLEAETKAKKDDGEVGNKKRKGGDA